MALGVRAGRERATSDERARLPLMSSATAPREYVGAYLAAMGGGAGFGGGIGEGAPEFAEYLRGLENRAWNWIPHGTRTCRGAKGASLARDPGCMRMSSPPTRV